MLSRLACLMERGICSRETLSKLTLDRSRRALASTVSLRRSRRDSRFGDSLPNRAMGLLADNQPGIHAGRASCVHTLCGIRADHLSYLCC